MGGAHAGSSSSMNFTSTPSLVTRQPIRRASSTEETSDEEASLRCSYSKLLRLSWQVVKLSDVQLLAPPPPRPKGTHLAAAHVLCQAAAVELDHVDGGLVLRVARLQCVHASL